MEIAYHEAGAHVLAHKEQIIAEMRRHMDTPLAVAATNAIDVKTGERLGADGAYAVSMEDAQADGPAWTTEDFHNFEKYGVVIDGHSEFEASLEKLAARIA